MEPVKAFWQLCHLLSLLVGSYKSIQRLVEAIVIAFSVYILVPIMAPGYPTWVSLCYVTK